MGIGVVNASLVIADSGLKVVRYAHSIQQGHSDGELVDHLVPAAYRGWIQQNGLYTRSRCWSVQRGSHLSGLFSQSGDSGPSMLPETPRKRLEWAIRESIVILGLLLFWIGAVLAVSLVLWVLALPYQLTGGRIFRPLVEFSRIGDGLWAGIIPLTTISASLYVLARVGELLIDHYSEML